MDEIRGRAGLCLLVTLSNEKAPSPIRACQDPHPPGCDRLGAAHGPRTGDCRSPVPAGLAGIPLPRPTGPFVHADLKRE
jgi:hypothetical protein